MWKITIAGLRAHRRRLLATSLAVVVGVAFLTGTLVLGDAMTKGFDDLFGDLNAGTDVVVRPAGSTSSDEAMGAGTLDASVVGRIADVRGVDAAFGSIVGIGQLLGADGARLGGDGPPTLAMNWVPDDEVNPFRLVDGHLPTASGEVVVDKATAATGGLRIGSTTTLLTPTPVPVTVVGLATFGSDDGAGTASTTWLSDSDARTYLAGGEDRVSSVSVVAAPDVDPTELRDRVAAALPSGAEAVTGSQLTDEQSQAIDEDFLGFLRTFLVVFAGVAILVATFSIHNTFSVVAAQRQREWALLRAVGATRGQVVRSTAVEVLLVGIIASVIGIGAGLGLASLLKAALEGMDLDVPTGSLALTGGTILAGMVVGTLATLVAGLGPVVATSRVRPIAALRDGAAERLHIGRVRTAIGAVLVVGGGVLMAGPGLGWWDGPVARVGLGALGVLVGALLLAPVIAVPVTRALGAPVAALRGAPGRLARENATRNPRRTARMATALLVGVGVVTVFMVFGASATGYVDQSLARSVRADLVIQDEGFSGAGLAPDLGREIAAIDGVEHVAGLGWGTVTLDPADAAPDGSSATSGAAGDGDTSLDVTVVDPAELAAVSDIGVRHGELATLAGDEIAVSSDELAERGWRLGDTVPFTFPDGAVEPVRVAVEFEHTDIVDGVLLPLPTWSRHVAQTTDAIVMIGLAPGADEAAVRAQVDAVAAAVGAPESMDHGEYVDMAAGEISQILGIVYVLLALSIVIALMGIANTLSLSVMERTRELGLLRAVGETRPQVRSMVRWEGVMVAVLGTALGMAIGLAVGWALVGATVGSELDGVFRAPVGGLVVVALVGAIAGVLAAWRPAGRAARMDVLRAIATT
jgi:putative ABC transport system permease protein